MNEERRKQQILHILAAGIRKVMEEAHLDYGKLQEIRLRTDQPLLILYQGEELFLPAGRAKKHMVTKEEIKETLEYSSHYSLYAYENEIRQGFLTVEGGHRVGVAGKAILEQEKVKSLQHISSVNIRMSHEIPGCADRLLPMITKNREVCHTLIISPPCGGKTTLIRTIMGLKKAASGSIFFEDKDITALPAWKRADMGIGYVPEGRRVFGNLTVEENLLTGCYKVKDNVRKRASIKRVYELFPRLEERKNQSARTMSGGEQQMLAIGRALVLEPRLLLIDEVSMGLMPIMVNTCFKIIKDLNDSGITVLVVEQNANKALKIANRGYVIETGNIILEDDAKVLRENDVVQKAYLGS